MSSWLGGQMHVTSAESDSDGGVASTIVTMVEHVAVLPELSVAVYVMT